MLAFDMKNLLLILLFVFLINTAAYSNNINPSFTFALDASYSRYDKYKPIQAYGIDMQFFYSKWFSFNSRWVFGPHFAHMPLLAYVCKDAPSSGDDSDIWKVILISEGCSIHIWVDDNKSLSLYANPIGYEYFGRNRFKDEHLTSSDPRWVISGAFGVKFEMFINELFFVTPYAEYKKVYSTHAKGYGGGLSVGLYY